MESVWTVRHSVLGACDESSEHDGGSAWTHLGFQVVGLEETVVEAAVPWLGSSD